MKRFSYIIKKFRGGYFVYVTDNLNDKSESEWFFTLRGAQKGIQKLIRYLKDEDEIIEEGEIEDESKKMSK